MVAMQSGTLFGDWMGSSSLQNGGMSLSQRWEIVPGKSASFNLEKMKIHDDTPSDLD